MVSCCSNIFKVPHLTNRCHRERIIQFFLRMFIFVNFIISTGTLSAAAIVRVKLGLPESCSGLTENIYMSTYTLFAVTVLSCFCMFVTCIKSREVKSSSHLTGHTVIFLIIAVAELFITILSIIQSNRIPEVLRDNSETFSFKECLMAVESRFRCCGFRSFTEWSAHLTSLGDAKMKVIFRYNQLDQGNSTLLHNITQLTPFDLFSESCRCVASKSTKCVTINYTLSDQYALNNTNTLSKNSTVDPNSILTPASVGTATIHSTACFLKILSQLKDMYMAVGLISVLAFVAQFIAFGFHFYLIHNLEGRAAVADIYRPPSQSFGHYIHGRSLKVTFQDLGNVQAESQSKHRGRLITTSEGPVSIIKTVTIEGSPREPRVIDGSFRLGDFSPRELKITDDSVKFTDFSPTELMVVDRSVGLNGVFQRRLNEPKGSKLPDKELNNFDKSTSRRDVSFKELNYLDRSVRFNNVSHIGFTDVEASITPNCRSPEELSDHNELVSHGDVEVIQCSKSISITF